MQQTRQRRVASTDMGDVADGCGGRSVTGRKRAGASEFEIMGSDSRYLHLSGRVMYRVGCTCGAGRVRGIRCVVSRWDSVVVNVSTTRATTTIRRCTGSATTNHVTASSWAPLSRHTSCEWRLLGCMLELVSEVGGWLAGCVGRWPVSDVRTLASRVPGPCRRSLSPAWTVVVVH